MIHLANLSNSCLKAVVPWPGNSTNGTPKGLNCVLLLSFVSSLFLLPEGWSYLEYTMGRGKKKRKRIPSTSSATSSAEREICVSCKEIVEDDAVECHWCAKWQHIKCANVSKSQYDMLNTCPDQIVFFCCVCIVKLPTVLEKFNGSKDTQSTVDEQIKVLQTQLTDLAAKMNNQIDFCFQQLEKKITTNLPSSNSVTQSLPSACEPDRTVTVMSASQVINEYRDRESRKLNIILHNVPESESTESTTRITHDTHAVADIADKIGIGSVDVSSTVRLGKIIEGRSRLLKVHLCNLQYKRLLLSNAKKLKGLSGVHQKIYITPDKRETG